MPVAFITRTLPIVGLAVVLSAGASSAQQQVYSSPAIDIGLVVADLEASADFYQSVLGMKRVGSFSVEGPMAGRLGLTDSVPFQAVMLKLHDAPQAPTLKLVTAGSPDRSKPTYIHHQSGVRYLTLHVTALRPLMERLRSRGIAILGEAPVALGNGSMFALVQDPDGVFVELIGPMEAARP